MADLIKACRDGKIDVVLKLLDNGADIDFTDKAGRTGLHEASKKGNKDIVELLLERGANIQASDKSQTSPLMKACRHFHFDVVSLLLDKGADIENVDEEGITPLQEACCYNYVEVATLLLDHGANIEAMDNNGITPLLDACRNGNVDSVTLLLNRGASISAVDKHGSTPLLRACAGGNVTLVQLLLDKGAQIETADNNGSTPLLEACKNSQIEVMKLLLDRLANVEAVDNDGNTAVLFACTLGLRDILALLIAAAATIKDGYFSVGSRVLAKNEYTGVASVGKVAEVHKDGTYHIYLDDMEHIEYAEKRMITSLTRSVVDKDGNSCLLLACKFGHIELVNMLLHQEEFTVEQLQYETEGNVPFKSEFCVDSCVPEGNTALHLACKHYYSSALIFKLVEENSANIYICNQDGCNCFGIAVQYCPLVVVHYMLQLEPLLYRHLDKKGRLPLSLATAFEHNDEQIAIVGQLLVRDMPIDLDTIDGSKLISHSYSWSVFLESPMLAVNQIVVIEWLFKDKGYEKFARELSFATDRRGRINIHIADESVMRHLHKYIYFCGRYDIAVGPAVHCSGTAAVVMAKDFGVLVEYESMFDRCCELSGESFLHKDEFRACAALIDVDKKFTSDMLENHCTVFDTVKDGVFTKDEFMQYCKSTFGMFRNVVIKFMSEENQYVRESQIREHQAWSSEFVVQQLSGPGGDMFSEAVKGLVLKDGSSVEGRSMARYHYGLVMPAADRNLDAIYRQERPDLLTISVLTKQLVECLRHIHGTGIIHGDLKLLNSVRIANGLRLIDFDASGEIDVTYAGAKFSSGILPPEMLCCLKNKEELEQYRSYFREEWDSNGGTPLWQKIKPKVCGHGARAAAYVVRTFSTHVAVVSDVGCESIRKLVQPLNMDTLPYTLVKMSPQLDMWSLGVLLYKLCSGKSFFPVNRDDDLTDAESFKTLLEWKDPDIEREICRYVTTPYARDLLMKLLKVNPDDRPLSMEDVLNHPFLASDKEEKGSFKDDASMRILEELQSTIDRIDERTRRIESLSKEIRNLSVKTTSQILATEKVLLRGMYESTEVKTPSCFVIVPEKLSGDGDKDQEDEMSNVEKVNCFFDYLENWVEHMKSGAQVKLKELSQGQTLYFYLVDELTMKPVIPSEDTDSPYPIEITTQAAFVTQMMPLVKVGFKAIRMVNGLAGIARCLGYPIPRIPVDKMDAVSGFIGTLDEDSSIADFEALEKCSLAMVRDLHDADSSQTTGSVCKQYSIPQNVRGNALRELSRFLEEYDPKSTYCGLQRICTREGLGCWAMEDSVREMESKSDPLCFPEDVAIDVIGKAIPAVGSDIPSGDEDALLPLTDQDSTTNRLLLHLTNQVAALSSEQAAASIEIKGMRNGELTSVASTPFSSSESVDLRAAMTELRADMKKQYELLARQTDSIESLLHGGTDGAKAKASNNGIIGNWFGSSTPSTSKVVQVVPVKPTKEDQW